MPTPFPKLRTGDRVTCGLIRVVFVAALLLVTQRGPAQETSRVIRSEELGAYVRSVVQQTQLFEIERIECPSSAPMRGGEITACEVTGADGRTVLAYVEQTDDQGSVLGNVYDPDAARLMQPAVDLFTGMLTDGKPGTYYDRWVGGKLRSSLDRAQFSEIIQCRLATLDKISSIRQLGTLAAQDAQTGGVTLHLTSQARPVRVMLFLVRSADGWRLDGFNFAPPLPKSISAPQAVLDQARDFVSAFDAMDWDMALRQLTVLFNLARDRLRPAVELEIKRNLLGGVQSEAAPELGTDGNGALVVKVPVVLENMPAEFILNYHMCGDTPRLNGYEIQVRPVEPPEVPAEFVSRVTELEFWRSGNGEIDVDCPGFEKVQARKGTVVECEASQDGRTMRAVIEFTNDAGGFKYRIRPSD